MKEGADSAPPSCPAAQAMLTLYPTSGEGQRGPVVAPQVASCVSAAEYLALLHPTASRGHAFLSGPAPERWRVFGEKFAEYDTGRVIWRDARCEPSRLPIEGEAWAEDREGKYVSMARYGGRRCESDLKEVNACWVDLDYYKVAGLDGWTPAQVLWAARERLAKARLPAPGIILNSGRGLLLIWLHTPIPAQALPRWQAIQKRLHKALSGLGVDRSGLSVTKVFRVPGGRNRGTMVRVLFPAAADDVERWQFDDFCREVLPKTRAHVAKKRADRASRSPRLAVVRDDLPKSAGAAAPWIDFYRKLSAEILRLKHKRFGDGPVGAGQRDLFLFALAVCESWIASAEVLEARLHELGQAVAGWDAKRTHSAVCSVLSRARRAARGEKLTWRGKRIDPR